MRSTQGSLQRTIGERLKEHIRTPSSIYDHTNTLGYLPELDNFSLLGGSPYHQLDPQGGHVHKSQRSTPL